ncbi:MAG TPA: L,D-transpeptidase family protein [Thermohalobaculum sp.]|nr:L,D-transpeptidase family protein [Thermohalobaculum sp.]
MAIGQSPGEPVRAFYEARGNAPFWLSEDGRATDASRELLAWAGEAAAHALPARRYGVGALATRLAERGQRAPSEAAAIEAALTRLYLTYARDLSSGIVVPTEVSDEIDVEPTRPLPAALLQDLEGASDIAAYLASLRPADPAYDGLLGLHREMQAIEAAGGWGATVDPGPTLRAGDRDDRVAQLRARLTALGDLQPRGDTTPDSARLAANQITTDAGPADGSAQFAGIIDPRFFDEELDLALRHFQARHGLNTDGVAGPATIGAVNTTAAERAAQIAVNLERLRWFEMARDRRTVFINIADYSMKMIENGEVRFETRTVVGKASKHRTPEFNDELEYLVVNPIWNVPYSIASKEILPLLKENPDYLTENNMELTGSDVPASEIDWSTVTRRSFPGRLRQLPGPDNALGFVKFLFPNRHSIYMHDTPSRKLFARDRRDFSHGCVRLEKPYDFAHLLLSLQPEVSDPVEKFDRLREKEGEQWIRLADPIPVYLTYRTAWTAGDGTIQFRADVYGRDRAVSQAMARAGAASDG